MESYIYYARIAKYIPISVMQLIIDQNVYKHNDKICVVYTGKNTKLDMTNPQKYIVMGLKSSDTKPNNYVIFYEDKWDIDSQMNPSKWDFELLRWVITECPNRNWQQ